MWLGRNQGAALVPYGDHILGLLLLKPEFQEDGSLSQCLRFALRVVGSSYVV